jgi:hypothetical protein
MPTNRTRTRRTPAAGRITPAAIAAWRAGDYWALHAALGLSVVQMPSWGDDDPGCSNPYLPGFKQPPDPVECKAALVALAGPPPKRWFYR